MASNCKTVRAEIDEARGGAWLSRDSQSHVGACAGCLEFMEEREKLRSLVGTLERVEAPGDFEFRLRARMAAAKEAKPSRFFLFRPAPGLATLALAATIVGSIYYSNATAPTAVQPSSHQPSVAQTAAPATTRDANEAVKVKEEVKAVAPSVEVERSAGVRPLRKDRRRSAAPSRMDVAKAREEGALDFGFKTSPVIKSTNVKLEVSSEPLRVVVRDERGARRRLPMNPVSFGAQSPVGKRRQPSPLAVADNEGVW